jgi:hypothetical protein
MGFNKRFVPELEDLKERLSMIGSTMFYKIYVTSPDALIGSPESIDYIDTFSTEHNKNLKSKNKQN